MLAMGYHIKLSPEELLKQDEGFRKGPARYDYYYYYYYYYYYLIYLQQVSTVNMIRGHTVTLRINKYNSEETILHMTPLPLSLLLVVEQSVATNEMSIT